MKKNYKTFIDRSALDLEKIIVSAGKIGVQVELAILKLAEIVDAKFQDIIVR